MVKPKILFVDDDPTITQIAQVMLEHYQFEPTVCSSGEECLTHHDLSQFDIVMLDVLMPGINGFEVCRQLRSHGQGDSIPILMMTSIDDAQSIRQAYELGATDFIIKPIEWEIIGQRLKYMIRSSQNTLQLSNTLKELTLNKERLTRAGEIAQLGHWEWHPQLNDMVWSEQIYKILQYDFSVPASFDEFTKKIHCDDKQRVIIQMQSMQYQDKAGQIEYKVELEDKSIIHLQQIIHVKKSLDGQEKILSGTLQNITDRINSESRIRHLAYYDSLTGLPNRQQFSNAITEFIQYSTKNNEKFALLFFDLDNFKHINDSFGHPLGDKLLTIVSKKLCHCLRGSDLIIPNNHSNSEILLSRFGGDEFTILLPNIKSPSDAARISDRIINTINQPIIIDDYELFVTTSLGISIFPNDGAEFDVLLKNADSAMYHCKNKGKNNYAFYSKSMSEKALERISLENALRRAVEQDQFFLEFQPKFNLHTNAIDAVEALLRWNHPELGLISPPKFIPLAEETGLIIELGFTIIEKACAALNEIRPYVDDNFMMGINVSSKQLCLHGFSEKLNKLIQSQGCTPQQIELEITENCLIEDIDRISILLSELSKCNYSIAIDDFGTGYSSLSYLQRLPIDRLKIDQSFVRNIETDSDSLNLTKAMIAMANNLNLKITAEGVENKAQYDLLNNLGCEKIQGYYISYPVSLETLKDKLKKPN